MRVVPLDPKAHQRKHFDCGEPSLDEWLEHQAGQAQTRHDSSRTFVLTDDDVTVLGYYALCSHSVDVDAVSSQLAKGQLRDYPIPAVLITRLAVATSHQRQGLGERLLADAVRQITAAATTIGIALIAVDALHDKAARFYEQYGFERWPADHLRLFVRVRDIAGILL